ncbi:aminomethyl-transferring glycine dehydrogenase subunit GcvPA [[Eubacterium] cellulosolvens]
MVKGHPFLPNSVEAVEKDLLNYLKIETTEELFKDIDRKLRTEKKLSLPGPFSELEVKRQIETTLDKNISAHDMPIFLGGGVWPHYVPAVIQEVIGRTEFVTSYTPYQAEISQGILQTLFEYQSLIIELTDMEYANCSMYDWSSALGEAALMAFRSTHRSEVLVPHYISPERRAVLKTYIEPSGLTMTEIKNNPENGLIDIEDLQKKIGEHSAAVYLEVPSFLGILETQVEEISQIAHNNNALFIIGADPTSLGVIRPPGDYGADIVIGEGQPLGLGMNYGGPLLGIFACRGEKLLRQMPGRIIGCTTTVHADRRAFCMALQTREQHIRREKATSNICTNNALGAVTAATYLSLLGPVGLKDLGEIILTKTHYALEQLKQIKGIEAPLFKAHHFKEFVIKFDNKKKLNDICGELIKRRIHGGIDLGAHFSELQNTMLFCVTETHSEDDIKRLVATLQDILEV